jgi:hypothetical protein
VPLSPRGRAHSLQQQLPPSPPSQPRNPALEIALGQWISAVTGMPLEYPDDVLESLRSGVLLCTCVSFSKSVLCSFC